MIKEEEGITPEGFHYIVAVITFTGVRNGYVGVLESSILYDSESFDMFVSNYNENVESYVDVHGGVTYSGNLDSYIIGSENNYWYYGFDCNHDTDGILDVKEFKEVLEKSTIPKEDHYNMIELHNMANNFRVSVDNPKSKEYVRNQCFKMSKQLKKLEGELK